MDGANMPPFPCTCLLKWNDYGYIFLAIIVTRPKYINGTLPCITRYLTLGKLFVRVFSIRGYVF